MSKIDPSALSDEQRKVLKALKDERDGRFRKEQKRYQIVIVILLIGVILLSLRDGGGRNTEVLAPDYSVTVEEPNAYPSAEVSQVGGMMTMAYEDKVTYDVKDNIVSLHYGNLSGSTTSTILQVIVYESDESELLLTQSGVLRPGYSVDVLKGQLDGKATLDPGSYSGVIRVLGYNEDMTEKPAVNTEISVTVIVR